MNGRVVIRGLLCPDKKKCREDACAGDERIIDRNQGIEFSILSLTRHDINTLAFNPDETGQE